MTPDKPLISSDEELGTFLRQRGFLATRQLLRDWYMLSSDEVTVLIDALRPRIVHLCAHGRLGTFQQLLSTPAGDREMGNGLFGIIPAIHYGHREWWEQRNMTPARYLPFGRGEDKVALKAWPPRAVHLDPEQLSLRLEGLTYVREGTMEQLAGGDFEVRLEGRRITLRTTHPAGLWNSELLSRWFPAYNAYVNEEGGVRDAISYAEGLDVLLGRSIVLCDTWNQMPRVRITSQRRALRIHAYRDEHYSGAFALDVSVLGSTAEDEVTLEMLPTPVTVVVNPMVNADRPQRLRVYSEVEPAPTVDGVPRDLAWEQTEEGTWDTDATFSPGKHHLTVEANGVIAVRDIYAAGDPRRLIEKSGRVVRSLQFEEGGVAGLFPTEYWTALTQPRPDKGQGYVCLSYMPRANYILAAAALVTGDLTFAEAGLRNLEATEDHSRVLDDGSIFVPPDLNAWGEPYIRLSQGREPGPDALNDECRPLNHSEYLKAGMFLYHAFKSLGDEANARRCLEYAARYTGTLVHMQQEDGRVCERYMYPTLEVTNPRYFPCPMFVEVLTLIELMKREGIEVIGAERLRQFVERQIEFLDAQPGSIFRTLHGSEASPNSLSWLAFMCEGFLMRNILRPGDDATRRAIEDYFILSIMMSHSYITMPTYYLAETCTVHDRPCVKTSMSDIQSSHLGMCMAKYFGGPLGEVGRLVADYSWLNRIADTVLENGALHGYTTEVPGVHLRGEEYGAPDCDFAGHGFMSCCWAVGEPLV